MDNRRGTASTAEATVSGQTDANSDGKISEKGRDFSQLLSDQIRDRITTTEHEVQGQLKQIEKGFRVHLQTCIDTCESMERLAIKEGRHIEAGRYRLQAKIYRQILDNYTLSKSYNRGL